MTLDELKHKVEKYRSNLKEKSGKICMWGESGPVGLSLIDAMIAMIESQERRIAELEKNSKPFT